MNSISRIVIIGAGMAGARAVINLRANGYEGAITLVGEEALLPYDRPPLSKASILAETDPDPVWLLDDGIVASLKAEVIKGIAVTAIDRAAKTVRLADGRSLPYDKLLIATGARPRKLPVPGGEHALLLRNQEEMLELRKRFLPGKRIVIIGGGFIGLELASSAAKKGCAVTLVEAQPRILMRGVPEAIARIIHDRHVAAGVTMMTSTGISHLTAMRCIWRTAACCPPTRSLRGSAPPGDHSRQGGRACDRQRHRLRRRDAHLRPRHFRSGRLCLLPSCKARQPPYPA